MSCLQTAKFTNNACRCYLRNNNSKMGLQGRLHHSHCIEDTRPKCSTTNFENSPCQTSSIKRRERPTDTAPQYSFLMKSMWERAKCCVTCVQEAAPIRHDVLYLKTDDFRERRYQRTWPQCSPRKRVPKKCIFEKLKVPEQKLRKRGEKNPDADMILPFNECYLVEKYETPCKPVTCKPKTRCVFAVPKCCQKRCTQYPSYSECCAKDPNPKKPNECNCLYPSGLCEVNEYARRMGLIKENEK